MRIVLNGNVISSIVNDGSKPQESIEYNGDLPVAEPQEGQLWWYVWDIESGSIKVEYYDVPKHPELMIDPMSNLQQQINDLNIAMAQILGG